MLAGFLTMSEAAERVVFDCNIFAQTLITPAGHAAQCVQHVLQGRLILIWSEFVLRELREIPNKPTPTRLGLLRNMSNRSLLA